MLKIKQLYNKYQIYVILFGGFVLNISIGSIYTYNYMAPYLVQFMKNHSKDHINKRDVSWIFLVNIFGMGSSVTFGDYISRKLGTSVTVFTAGWLMSINILLMSYVLKTYIVAVILTYGLLNGIGSGIVYGITMGAVCSWFPNRRGLIIGILVSGFGFSTCLFELIQFGFLSRGGFLNWQNYILNSYLLLGGLCMGLQILGSLLLKSAKQESSNCSESLTQPSIIERIMEGRYNNLKPHNLIFEVDFWIMWISYSLLSSCIIMNLSFSKELGLRIIADYLSSFPLDITVFIESLTSAIGGIIWGLIIDRFGYKIVIICLSIGLTIFSGSFYFTLTAWNNVTTSNTSVSHNGAIPSFFVWIIFLSFFPSGVFVIFPQTCGKMFGRKHFIANYGTLYTAWSAGAVIAASISLTLWDHHKSPDMKYLMKTFIAIAVMSSLSVVINIFYRGKVRYQEGLQLSYLSS